MAERLLSTVCTASSSSGMVVSKRVTRPSVLAVMRWCGFRWLKWREVIVSVCE